MLRRAHINPLAIDFRAKRYWSLYQKMKLYEMDLSRVHDVVALRVIVRDVADCYAALGIVHQEWPPFPGRIKDYIAMPKPNGYRSLHTTVIGPDGKTLEIQIRTEDMHRENEYGIAAHWAYKEHRHTPSSARRLARETEWIQQLQQWQSKHATDPEKSLDAMKIDFFKDRIFVITPQGTVLDLPAGSTPVDFAYTIHSEVGDGCTGAKVNDQFVPLDYVLRSGDLVEIIVQQKKKPSKDWLAFVKTSIAKARIRAAFREKDRAFVGGPTKTEFRIVVHDRVGLIKDIANVIARAHINILGMQTNSVPGSKFPIDRVECAVTDKEKVERLLLKLKKIKEIKEISYKII
jgi:GTP pyrophosphokinase